MMAEIEQSERISFIGICSGTKQTDRQTEVVSRFAHRGCLILEAINEPIEVDWPVHTHSLSLCMCVFDRLLIKEA